MTFHAWSEEDRAGILSEDHVSSRDLLIFDVTNHLLDRYVYSLPVDVLSICKALGIPVFDTTHYQKLGMCKEELFSLWGNRDGAAGRICGQDVINYNEKAPGTRARFTLAEELMHVLLGHTADHRFSGCPAAYSPELYQRYEREAKTAAGLLLMPASVYVGQSSGGSAKDLSVSVRDISARTWRSDEERIRKLASACGISRACAWTTAQYYEGHLEIVRAAATRKVFQVDRPRHNIVRGIMLTCGENGIV